MTQTQQRPLGITILAVISIILAGLSILWSLLVLGFGGLTSLTGALFSAEQMASFGGSAVLSGSLGIVVAILHIVVAIGLLRLKQWAWLLAVIAYAVTVILGIAGIFGGGFLTVCCGALGLILPIGVLIYLLSGNVRAAFGR
jgi:hypothetical protein